MKIGGSYTLAVDPARACELLRDPVLLARCMPGCDHLARIGPDEYEMKMKMVISSIQGLFAGKVCIADHAPPNGFRLLVEGAGKVGFVKGEGLLTFNSRENGTEVRYEGEVRVGGMIAGVGQRLLDTTARLMIKRFFDRFAGEISQVSYSAGS